VWERASARRPHEYAGDPRARADERASGMMPIVAIEVVPYSHDWPVQFHWVAEDLRQALRRVCVESIEHVGSTSVPGLAARPVLDIDVIVQAEDVLDAVAALEAVGYCHQGDLGVTGREAFRAPDDEPRRNVYVCRAETIHVRNHLAVRDVLRTRPHLRKEYAATKLDLASDPAMDIRTYVDRKSTVLQKVLREAGLHEHERQEIWRVNHTSG
jgi:GrpB-like predicted nucleotidyltransferase (UPF0157 family)